MTDVDSLSNVETTLRFSMEDGVIKNICPSNDETQESLNFKKSILSMLQVQYSGAAYFFLMTFSHWHWMKNVGDLILYKI